MAHDDTLSRFDRLSREILNGSLPYGLSPGQPPPESFAVVLSHDLEDGVTVIVAVGRKHSGSAMTMRNMTLAAAERVQRDFQQFNEEMQLGEFGEMLPFSYLPRRVAIRRLKRLTNAN